MKDSWILRHWAVLVAVLAGVADGWSYNRLAEQTTLSKGRIGQLAREARRRAL